MAEVQRINYLLSRVTQTSQQVTKLLDNVQVAAALAAKQASAQVKAQAAANASVAAAALAEEHTARAMELDAAAVRLQQEAEDLQQKQDLPGASNAHLACLEKRQAAEVRVVWRVST